MHATQPPPALLSPGTRASVLTSLAQTCLHGTSANIAECTHTRAHTLVRVAGCCNCNKWPLSCWLVKQLMCSQLRALKNEYRRVNVLLVSSSRHTNCQFDNARAKSGATARASNAYVGGWGFCCLADAGCVAWNGHACGCAGGSSVQPEQPAS